MRSLWRPGRPDRAPEEAAPAEDGLIVLRGVEKSFASVSGMVGALRGVELQVAPGEFVAVVGKSGSGKSTLLKMIAGIDRPTRGQVWVAGAAVHRLSESDLAVWRRRHLGVIFQFFQLLPMLSVVENVMLPMDLLEAVPAAHREDRAMALLAQVGMDGMAEKRPDALSGGEQQRVAIARALANDPPLLIADEPTGNLDSAASRAVFALFEQLPLAGKTVVMVTHDRELALRAHRRVLIADGAIVEDSGLAGRQAAPAEQGGCDAARAMA